MPKNKVKLPLSKTHPKLAKEADGWDPKGIFAHIGTGKIFKWKCKRGHRYEATLGNRVNQHSGCPYCSGHKVLAGFNDLATTHPEIAKQADGWDVKKVSAGSHKKVNWICSKGHSYKSIVKSRIRNPSGGCPTCDNKRVLFSFNDLATTHPDIALEAYGWDPKNVVAGSNKIFEWRCQEGHHFKTSCNKRTSRGDNCPFCSSHKVLAGFNDLKTKYPSIASEAVDWDTSTVLPASNKRVQWKCPIGHLYKSSPNARTGVNGRGCAICSNQKLLVGFNDFATTHPELAKQAFGWNPKTVFAGTHSKRRWKCINGHIFKQAVANRTSKGSGCHTCVKYGYDPNQNAHIYFLHHGSWDMLQIGITNNLQERLVKHTRAGWEIIEVRGPMDGYLTQQWETAILRMLKAKGADLSNSKIAGKFDGYSEAWSKSTFPVESIKELMRLTEEFEEK